MAESLLKRSRLLVVPCIRDLIIQEAYSSLPSHVLTLRSFSIEKERSVNTWGWIGSLNYLVYFAKEPCQKPGSFQKRPSHPILFIAAIPCVDATFLLDPMCWRYCLSMPCVDVTFILELQLQSHNSGSLWPLSMFVSGRIHRQICSLMPDMAVSKETHG